MSTTPYEIEAKSLNRYTFTSEGHKGAVMKEVVIQPLGRIGYYTFGFGDVKPDGRIDDKSETNNGDLIRVFSTIIFIMEGFMNRNPKCTLFFTGSTSQRTTVYNTILRRYYGLFSEKYNITGVDIIDGTFEEFEFNPKEERIYHAFFVRKK